MRFSIKYIRNSSPRTLSSTLAFAHLDGSSSTARATSRTRAVWFLTTPLGAACTLGVTCWNDSSRRCCLTSGECSRRRSILWTSVIVPRLHGLQRLGGTSCGRLGWPCMAMSCEVWGPLRNREPSARKKHNSKKHHTKTQKVICGASSTAACVSATRRRQTATASSSWRSAETHAPRGLVWDNVVVGFTR